MDEETRIKSYKDLLVWQNGIQLVKQVYVLTHQFPNEEKFGLISQMRRAAVSVPSNIAEGLETQAVVSIELGFCSQEGDRDLLDAIHRLQKMLHSLRTKLATNH